MRYNKIRELDISNGPGVRVSLFTQGCPFHCKGCFNEVTWDYDGGEEFNSDTMKTIKDLCNKSYIRGLSILGGEPLIEDNLIPLAALVYLIKSSFPSKSIWIWTGNTFEHLLEKYMDNIWFHQLMDYVDVLVDGPFMEELRDPTLLYKGSSNQRVIDVKKTFEKNEVVLYE